MLLVNIPHPDLCLQHLSPVPTHVLLPCTPASRTCLQFLHHVLLPCTHLPMRSYFLWLVVKSGPWFTRPPAWGVLTHGGTFDSIPLSIVGWNDNDRDICQLAWDPWGTNPPYSPTAQCVLGIHCTPIHSLCNILNSFCLSFPCKRQHPLHYFRGQQRKKGTTKNYLKFCWVRSQQLHTNVGTSRLEWEEEKHVGLVARVKVLFPHLDRCKGISYKFIQP